MPRIKILSQIEAQKIAAGEVVERPASVVKELLENAVDAGSTKITVAIKDGGKELIRIIDNGCGMDKDDAQLCFEKHATSKINSIDELESIATFGFRGEALASISAVSKVTLITKQENTNEGLKLEVENNTIVSNESVPANTGTDIAIHGLFYNVPARLKFLKKHETEWRHIQQLFQAFCLDYPSIHFTLISENKQILNCPPVSELKKRIAQLVDNSTALNSIEIERKRDDKNISITGIISNHQTFKYDRNGIFFFVNKRWVKNQHLSRALIKGYQNVIPHGRFPTASIHISVNPNEVDINIHPRKEEVKFLHPRIIEQLLQQVVKETLENNLSQQIKKDVTFASSTPVYTHQSTQAFTPFDFDETYPVHKTENKKPSAIHNNNQSVDHHNNTRDTNNNAYNQSSYPNKDSRPLSMVKEQVAQAIEQVVENQPILAQETPFYRIIGQYNKTYILIEQDKGLFIVDQHAAHERILYEQFSKRFDDIATINLIFPQLITLSAQDMQLFEPYLALFEKHGIIIESFGSNQLRVQSIPAHFKNASVTDLIHETVSWVKEYQDLEKQEFFKKINEKLHAQMACKAAVKAGDTLSTEQMQKILADLHTTPNRLTCPHGRPTGWLLSIDEVEKRFKRKL